MFYHYHLFHSEEEYELTSEFTTIIDPQQQSLTPLFSKIWHWIKEVLVSRPELQVWQQRGFDGQIWWCAYDPCTGQSKYFEDEEEIRIWMEQLYYY